MSLAAWSTTYSWHPGALANSALLAGGRRGNLAPPCAPSRHGSGTGRALIAVSCRLSGIRPRGFDTNRRQPASAGSDPPRSSRNRCNARGPHSRLIRLVGVAGSWQGGHWPPFPLAGVATCGFRKTPSAAGILYRSARSSPSFPHLGRGKEARLPRHHPDRRPARGDHVRGDPVGPGLQRAVAG